MMRSNRFKALEFPQDPTDYEDFEDVAPYNKLVDGKWTSLWMNRHPIAYKISGRFSCNYDGKLMWRELNAMKEEIEKLQKSLDEYQKEVWPRSRELNNLIREQEKLCSEDNRASKVNTILLSAIAASKKTDNPQTPLGSFFHQVPDSMMMMQDIISFIPIETCAEKLQKHLDVCSGLNGKYKCTKNYVSYDCQFKENGRCSHYYEIERANEEIERDQYYADEDKDKIESLEVEYERALSVKEDRLEEYLEYLYDDW